MIYIERERDRIHNTYFLMDIYCYSYCYYCYFLFGGVLSSHPGT